MIRKFWGIVFLILTACSPIQAQPTSLPPTSLPTATSTIQPTEASTPTEAPTLTPTELLPEVLCEIAAPALGAKYPSDLLDETKQLVFWTEEEKSGILGPDGLPVYESLVNIAGNLINQNLRVGEIVVAEGCGYGVVVTKPDGKLVWMKHNDRLGFRPDDLGMGTGYEVVPNVPGKKGLWIDMAGNQTYVAIDGQGKIADIFRPEKWSWDSQEQLAVGPNWVEERLASGDYYTENFTSSWLELSWNADRKAHGDMTMTKKDNLSMLQWVAKQVWEGEYATGHTRDSFEDYLRKLESGEKKLTLWDVKEIGNLLTEKLDHLDEYTFNNVVMQLNGYSPKGFPIDLPYSMGGGSKRDNGLAYDPRKPGTLYFLYNADKYYRGSQVITVSPAVEFGLLLRGNDYWIEDPVSNFQYFDFEEAGAEAFIDSVVADVDFYITDIIVVEWH